MRHYDIIPGFELKQKHFEAFKSIKTHKKTGDWNIEVYNRGELVQLHVCGNLERWDWIS